MGAGSEVRVERRDGDENLAFPEPPRVAPGPGPAALGSGVDAPAPQPFPSIPQPWGLPRSKVPAGPRGGKPRLSVKGSLGKPGLALDPDPSFDHTQASFSPASFSISAAGQPPSLSDVPPLLCLSQGLLDAGSQWEPPGTTADTSGWSFGFICDLELQLLLCRENLPPQLLIPTPL